MSLTLKSLNLSNFSILLCLWYHSQEGNSLINHQLSYAFHVESCGCKNRGGDDNCFDQEYFNLSLRKSFYANLESFEIF